MMMLSVVLFFALLHHAHKHNKPLITQPENLILPPEHQARLSNNEPKPIIKWQTVTIKTRDSLSKIFRDHHISQGQLSEILTLPDSKRILANLKPGTKIQLAINPSHELQALKYRADLTTIINIFRQKNHFQSRIEHLIIDKEQAFAHGEIKASLFNAGLRANLSSRLIMQLVDIFQWDIDFASNIRPGDSFDVIYEQQYINGEPVKEGNILSAQFINHGNKYTAVRFTDPKGYTDYFTDTGRSLKKQFTRAPVKFTRISSYFKPKRWHPVLHRFRKHTGIDYAAPAGTPIKATGDGKIQFIGRKGGYGRAIIINHGNKVTTLYGHMLRYARHIHKNTRVKQGQLIGYVGMSGLATGYHVHYEFRINNKYRDPLKVKLPRGKAVPTKYRTAFNKQKDRLLNHMTTFRQTALAAKQSSSDKKA